MSTSRRSITISGAAYAQLKAYCTKHGESMSGVIEALVAHYLRSSEKPRASAASRPEAKEKRQKQQQQQQQKTQQPRQETIQRKQREQEAAPRDNTTETKKKGRYRGPKGLIELSFRKPPHTKAKARDGGTTAARSLSRERRKAEQEQEEQEEQAGQEEKRSTPHVTSPPSPAAPTNYGEEKALIDLAKDRPINGSGVHCLG